MSSDCDSTIGSADTPSGDGIRNGAGRSGATGLWDKVRDELSRPGDENAGPGAVSANDPDGQFADESHNSMNWARAYGRYFVVGGIICGLALPELAAAARPLLVPLLVLSLVVALMQFDFTRLAAFAKRKTLVLSLIFSLLALIPAFVALEAKAVLVPYGLPPAIADGMILAALAPPLLTAPVIAFLLGLDALLAFVISLVAHIVAPVTIAFFAESLIGPEISIGHWELAMRLSLLIGAGFAIGLILNAVKLPALLGRAPKGLALLDGLSVVTLSLIAVALMDGVTELALTDLNFVVIAVVCGFILNPVLQLFGAALFAANGIRTALTAGLLSGYRNTGVLIAVLAGSTDPKILTFLAIVQIPTFLMPMLSSSVVGRIRTREVRTAPVHAR